jgi:hypothetical protein
LFAILLGWYQGNVRLYQSILLAEKTLRLLVVEGLRKACVLYTVSTLFFLGQGAFFFWQPAKETALVLRDSNNGDVAVISIIVAAVHLQQLNMA